MAKVLIIAGSKTDSAIVERTASILDELEISYRIEYASAHREPERVESIIKSSEAEVFIAVAGLAAALPGAVASYTQKPVIGVPVNVSLEGLDALLSMIQMPKGVPVATVGIDNGPNAAYLAARILGVTKRDDVIPSSYSQSGVDENSVSRGLVTLGRYVRESFKLGEVMQDYGHYANTVKINDQLCIALSTDGVGSKVLVAKEANRYDSIGIDCVAMNVNDLICVGAMPVGFVDYLALEKPLPEYVIDQIGQGLLKGCEEAGIPILGGETAILPEIIKGFGGTGIDLAGTAVGIAQPSELIDGSGIASGDVMIGVSSSGLHSNGFTLARKVLFSKYVISDRLSWGSTLEEVMLQPTRIYVPHFKALRQESIDIKGVAHITGSGFKKILRLGHHKYEIDEFPEIPLIFNEISEIGEVDVEEMFSTFNMGMGLIMVISEEDTERALKTLSKFDKTYRLGHVEYSERGVVDIKPFEVKLS
ncbi:MAG: phosphoribosylformylglycinamidine cyclo-ligase [Promethearchaeota archaeon]